MRVDYSRAAFAPNFGQPRFNEVVHNSAPVRSVVTGLLHDSDDRAHGRVEVRLITQAVATELVVLDDDPAARAQRLHESMEDVPAIREVLQHEARMNEVKLAR